MRPVYRLVLDPVSDDTVAALKALLSAAQAGKLQGVIYGAILTGRQVLINTTGEARRSPIFSLGIVSMLHADLIDRTRKDGEH